MTSEGLRIAERKMRAAGASETAIAAFADAYRRLLAGESGLVRDDEVEPVLDVPRAEDLGGGAASAELLDRAVVIKLNGGLGTSMGLSRAKSLIEAKDGLSFLEIVLRQVLALRRAHGARLPLVLMNSFFTRDDALAVVRRQPGFAQDAPLDFVQSRVPKLRADELAPIDWPADPVLEWAPPGHGDFYTAISGSGVLDTLLERGYEYAFVSNADNLGAVLDPAILAWIAAERIPLLMEVVVGNEADRKGGHLARRADGRLLIRETAQAPETEGPGSFADFEHWRHYSANNLWLDLRALASLLAERGALALPLIVNRKHVDPRDPSTPQVLQLESAIGAAIGEVEGARAICVPRARFVPVKNTDDLLVLRSDAYRLAEDWRIEPAHRGEHQPVVRLDPRYYRRLGDLEARFPSGPPSLRECERLAVDGDVTFGRGVVARGSVAIRYDGPAGTIADGSVLEGVVTAAAAPER